MDYSHYLCIVKKCQYWQKFNMTMEIKRDSWDIYKFPKTGKGTPISHRHAF